MVCYDKLARSLPVNIYLNLTALLSYRSFTIVKHSTQLPGRKELPETLKHHVKLPQRVSRPVHLTLPPAHNKPPCRPHLFNLSSKTSYYPT
jgi:hypothetical protein